jgi:hypothetical protein
MIEVLKQALDALDNITDAIYINSVQEANAFEKSIEAMTSLRQAIAGLESQEPVALETVYETIIQWDEGGGKRSRRDLARRIIDLYTHPPQRTWQGLTIDEREQIQQECFGKVPHHVAFAHAVEAKLKEKNT